MTHSFQRNEALGKHGHFINLAENQSKGDFQKFFIWKSEKVKQYNSKRLGSGITLIFFQFLYLKNGPNENSYSKGCEEIRTHV